MTVAVLCLLLGAAVCRVVEVRSPRYQQIVATGIAVISFATWLLDRTTAAEWWNTQPQWWVSDRLTWFFQGLVFCWLGGHLLLAESFALEMSALRWPPSRWLVACGAALLMTAGGEFVRFAIAADLLWWASHRDLFELPRKPALPNSSVGADPRWWLWPVASSGILWLGMLLIAAETGSTVPLEISQLPSHQIAPQSWLLSCGQILLLMGLIQRVVVLPVVWRIDEHLSQDETCTLIRSVGIQICAVTPFALRFSLCASPGAGVPLICICLIFAVAVAWVAAWNLQAEESLARCWLALYSLNAAWVLLGWAVLIFSASEDRESPAELTQIVRSLTFAVAMLVSAFLVGSLGWLTLTRHLLLDRRERWLWQDWGGLVKAAPLLGGGFSWLWFSLLGVPLTPGGWGRIGCMLPALLTILPGKGNDLVGQPVFRLAVCGLVAAEIFAWKAAVNWLRGLFLDEPLNTQLNRRWTVLGLLSLLCGTFLLVGGAYPQLLLPVIALPSEAGE